ncbi:MAG: hypothetical protein KBS43_05305 [Oscillospiraceae bacterium]|nr:hypothetical protein [Candidatus Limimonas coprohippi]MCQ2488327.1 hypothetical protein [Clostridia bacterium]
MKKRIVAILLALAMVLSFSACAVDMDFLLNGWDGVYEEKERAQYVYPDPTVRTHEIRENYRVSSVKHQVGTASTGAGTGVAATDAP